jgi:hypothetical protein
MNRGQCYGHDFGDFRQFSAIFGDFRRFLAIFAKIFAKIFGEKYVPIFFA